MSDRIFVARSRVAHPLPDVFAWHERPGAFSRLTPPWDPVRLLERRGTIHDGDGVVVQMKAGPVPVELEAVHFDYVANQQFCDRQVRGPFASWTHRHGFSADGPGATVLEDRITYRLPGGALGRLLGGATVERKLSALFAHRHATLARDLARHARFPGPRLRIAVAGASGFVGTALTTYLATAGHDIVRLVRSQSRPAPDAVGTSVPWDPYRGELNLQALGPIDAVINLAGENVGEGRWTPERKQQLRDSRVIPTGFLADTVARLQATRAGRPLIFLSTSAIGIYGDRGSEVLTEAAAPGDDFLAQLGVQWEAAAEPARAAGARVVHPRIGLVLSPQGGPLAKLLPFFRAGLGGRLGNGEQYWSWLAIDDLLHAFEHLLGTDTAHGAFNLAARDPVSNRTLTAELGRALSRPTLLPVPAAGLKLLLGDLGAMVLSGARVSCERLISTGFSFAFPDLGSALPHLFGTTPAPALSPIDNGVKLELAPV